MQCISPRFAGGDAAERWVRHGESWSTCSCEPHIRQRSSKRVFYSSWRTSALAASPRQAFPPARELVLRVHRLAQPIFARPLASCDVSARSTTASAHQQPTLWCDERTLSINKIKRKFKAVRYFGSVNIDQHSVLFNLEYIQGCWILWSCKHCFRRNNILITMYFYLGCPNGQPTPRGMMMYIGSREVFSKWNEVFFGCIDPVNIFFVNIYYSISLIFSHQDFNCCLCSLQMKWPQNGVNVCVLTSRTHCWSQNVNRSCIGSATDSRPL